MADDQKNVEKAEVKSLLTPFQSKWLTIALIFAALLLANTLYLLSNRLLSHLPSHLGGLISEGAYSISKLFQIMVLSHTGLGFLVVGMLLIFAIWHLPRVWRRHRRATVVSGIFFLVSGLVLAVSGPFIMYAAASREHAWVWWTHVIAGALVPVAYVLHRLMSYVRPVKNAYSRFGLTMAAVFLTVMIGQAYTQYGQPSNHSSTLMDGQEIRKFTDSTGQAVAEPALPGNPLMLAGIVSPKSPFFPSAATTTTGTYLPERIITRGDVSSPEKLAPEFDQYGFVVNEQIGSDTCARCHQDIVNQWSSSAHRFASFNNPFYEATINDMRKNATSLTEGVAAHLEHYPQWSDRVGEIKSKWCSGCHDPSLMLAGQMTETINRRTPQAQAGLTCLACHAIDSIHDNTGNANYNIADHQEDPYIFANADTGSLRAYLHDTAIKAKPDVHKSQMLKPFFLTSEMCATCHKVSLQEPVNNYRWLRGQNEYDNWHDSGVALNASRTFYLPPKKRFCQECHMPPEPAVLGDVSAKNGMVRSHRFIAVNTALPFIRGDQETIDRIEDFLQSEKMRIDVFAMTRERDTGKEKTYALNHFKPSLKAGELLTFDVVVRNQGVGHTFPGGTNDSNQGWIEFTLLDDAGNQIYQSGFVQPDGYVDPEAHFFRVILVDRKGEAIHRRNAQDIYAPVYASVIGPGTAQAVHYRLVVPETAGKSLTIRARLLWRKFDRAYTEFAFTNNPDGFKRFDQCPDLPITEITRNEVTLRVGSKNQEVVYENTPVDEQQLASDWIRFNDYGIGLLLQSDTKGARDAFEQVKRLVPQRIDGARNLARVAIRDGELAVARKWLLECEKMDSNNAQTAWFWGVLLQEDGRYYEAAGAYQRVLQQFPEDRAAWRNLGRVYYLNSQFEEAIEAMGEVLKIDPEDRIAHYHKMLASRSLGLTEQAEAAEIAYKRYKIDESAAEVTQSYRLQHPRDNLEAQAIHVHELSNH